MLHMMLAEPDADRATFASLRTVIYGGSPISEALLAECMRTLDCGLLQIYGSTESGNVMFRLPPREHVAGSPFLRSAGLPGPDVRAKVVDEDDRPVPTGTIGEVCVRAPSVMVEYWNNPEATARTLRNGWLHMGDVGYLDETGHLFLCARVNDTIIVAGENIYPAEIENALTAHPAVADAAVFGVPDEQWGERVHACVVLRPEHTATPRDLMRFLNGYIADFKVPTGYTFVAEVPRNATGKILRRELREQVLADARELVT
jgi:acyl-CoA synthetase (AMP-forming)/AMP-acid ligase II